MDEEKFLNILKIYHQEHILHHYLQLHREKKEEFLVNLKGINLPLGFALYEKFSKKKISFLPKEIKPAPIISVQNLKEDLSRKKAAYRLGVSMIREGEVAVLIVAGGQGTRLGFPGPKGFFPITPVQKKSLFQLFAEMIKAISQKYKRKIPLLIMTSQENHQETAQFFASHNFFSLSPEDVHFFCQGMLPTFTPEGQLILKDDTHLLANPDGHGGSLKALFDSGLLHKLLQEGFTELFYCQVDNPLVKIADPIFLGIHRMEEAEISTKVVRRRDKEEKVGIYGLVNGQPAIIEYSDFPEEEYNAQDESGNLRYWAGNTAIHVISLPFIERLNQHGFVLPYHRAIKEATGRGPGGQSLNIKGWKFETFVFDALPFARRCCALEVIREEEFAPLKNKEGNDSPSTVRAALNSFYRQWLQEAGAEVAPHGQVEIAPSFALEKEEFLRKIKGKKLIIKEDTYLA